MYIILCKQRTPSKRNECDRRGCEPENWQKCKKKSNDICTTKRAARSVSAEREREAGWFLDQGHRTNFQKKYEQVFGCKNAPGSYSSKWVRLRDPQIKFKKKRVLKLLCF